MRHCKLEQISTSLEDIVLILRDRRRNENIGMSRQELKAQAYLGRVMSTGVVNHVISGLKNVVVEVQGSFYLINCRRNRNGHYEYSIQTIPNPSIMLPRERGPRRS